MTPTVDEVKMHDVVEVPADNNGVTVSALRINPSTLRQSGINQSLKSASTSSWSFSKTENK